METDMNSWSIYEIFVIFAEITRVLKGGDICSRSGRRWKWLKIAYNYTYKKLPQIHLKDHEKVQQIKSNGI